MSDLSIACLSKVSKSCKQIGLRRGSCIVCYQKLYKLIKAGLTTWEQLEKEGKALPSQGISQSWISPNDLKTEGAYHVPPGGKS